MHNVVHTGAPISR